MQLPESALFIEPGHLAMLRALLAEHAPQAEVWAYGSRVCGGAHEGSDLDLVLRHPEHPERDAAGWRALKQALEDSRLPMLIDLHRWSHLPADFRREIEAAHVVLQTGFQSGPRQFQN